MHDGSWAFQHLPDAADSTVQFWNGNGNDQSGAKTEHNSPDPYGGARFMQSSTAGYFGIYDVTGIDLSSGFPTSIPSVYTNLQGEVDVTSQIMLGGKGMKANGEPQLTNSDSYKVNADGSISDSAKVTFEVTCTATLPRPRHRSRTSARLRASSRGAPIRTSAATSGFSRRRSY